MAERAEYLMMFWPNIRTSRVAWKGPHHDTTDRFSCRRARTLAEAPLATGRGLPSSGDKAPFGQHTSDPCGLGIDVKSGFLAALTLSPKIRHVFLFVSLLYIRYTPTRATIHCSETHPWNVGGHAYYPDDQTSGWVYFSGAKSRPWTVSPAAFCAIPPVWGAAGWARVGTILRALRKARASFCTRDASSVSVTEEVNNRRAPDARRYPVAKASRESRGAARPPPPWRAR